VQNANKSGNKLLHLLQLQLLTTECHAIQHVADFLGYGILQLCHESWQQLLQHCLVLQPDSCWCLAQGVQHISDSTCFVIWH
jgi:hypothetical protein